MAEIITKKGKKRWFSILASKEFNNIPIGETTAYDANSLIGRTVHTNLMDLIGDPKKQNFIVKFKINSINGDKGVSEIVGYSVSSSFLRRAVKKEKTRIDDSFLITTKDGVKVKVKPFIITKTKVNNSISTALRKKGQEFLSKCASGSDYSIFVMDLLNGKTPKDLRTVLNKIVPLNTLYIRMFERE
ncbi:MAG: hypothetical protein HYS32_01415 [Candidatus Woesearchaeota archaeon]|nr:MAG: hypothetical protein HYS32_01415 [Candidatus Woesearchaeota archaeon]